MAEIGFAETEDLPAVFSLLEKNDRLAVTWKTSSNAVFSFGRDGQSGGEGPDA